MTAVGPTPGPRTAVITGAASERGIGRAVAKRLASQGWSTAILDQDGAGAERLARALIGQYGRPSLGIAVDIADEAQVDRAITLVEEGLPPIAALANIAGISSPTPFLDMTSAEWDRVFAVNSRGTFLMTRRVVPGMVTRGFGRVVSVSSASAQRGGGTYSTAAYSASKAAIVGMSRALAREVSKHGVTVNIVSPGPIDTDIMGGPLTAAKSAELIDSLLVPRLGTVDDVAALIAFLIGPDAGYITGATYNINGGLIVD